jgi:predicted Rossmann fold flavoprotein
MSLQASSVVDALRFEMEDLKIGLKLSEKVCSIIKNGNSFTVETEKRSYDYSATIIACGGKTYGKISSDSGYTLLKSLGHKIESLFPAIVQIKTSPEICKQLKGVKINGAITIKSNNETATEKGEILFCDYGISGPPVLQLSRLANCKNAIAIIDMLPEINSRQLHDALLYRLNKFKSRPLSELFTGFLNKRIGQVLIKSIGYNINQLCSEFKTSDLPKLINSLKGLELSLKGTTGFENAQVTAGGAQTTQFFDNCMSKKAKGLFAIGEVLNVDGDCGGFNLAFAWASAHAAADGVINYLSKE